jgi:nucleoside-diphosphate-sugar epimerase
MIFSTDIGRITVDFMNVAKTDISLDCGRGIGLIVNEIAQAVNEYFDNAAGIKYLPMRRGETPDTRLVADIEPLRNMLGSLSFADWEVSLAATLQWYADQAAPLEAR